MNSILSHWNVDSSRNRETGKKERISKIQTSIEREERIRLAKIEREWKSSILKFWTEVSSRMRAGEEEKEQQKERESGRRGGGRRREKPGNKKAGEGKRADDGDRTLAGPKERMKQIEDGRRRESELLLSWITSFYRPNRPELPTHLHWKPSKNVKIKDSKFNFLIIHMLRHKNFNANTWLIAPGCQNIHPASRRHYISQHNSYDNKNGKRRINHSLQSKCHRTLFEITLRVSLCVFGTKLLYQDRCEALT